MPFDVNYAWEILPRLLAATVVTFEATMGGMAIATVGGLMLAVLRLSPVGIARRLAGAFIEVVRSTPLITQLFIAFYLVMPRLGLPAEPLVAGILGLGIHYSSYTAEVYRAGIQGVPRGQWEAAAALNMTPLQTWRRVILPQAVPPIIPPLGNYLISMFKDTPVLFTITVVELFATSLQIAGEKYRFFEPITLVGLIFLVLSYPSSLIVRRLEVRYARR
jgi:polar amino acid transport system permease protein